MGDATSTCWPCALTRAAWRTLRAALLPRTLAFIGALAVLAMMAPSSIPPSTVRAVPASVPAVPTAASAAAAAQAVAEGAVASAPASAAAVPGRGASAEREASARGGGGADKTGERVPPPPQRPASTAASGTGAASASTLRFRNVLPYARVGVPWRHAMLEGTPPFEMRFVGERPPWIDEFAAGTLAGTPREAKTYEFTLQGATEGGAQSVTQTFSVRVLPARPQAASSAPLLLDRMTHEELSRAPAVERDLPSTWRLEVADLKKLSEPPEPVQEDASLETKPPPVSLPTAEQWQGMLGALVGVDYPTEAHFRKVLQIAHCEYYRVQLASTAKERTKLGAQPTVAPAFDCEEARRRPRGAPPAAGKAPAAAEKAAQARIEDFHKLMPSEDAVVTRARKTHRLRMDFNPLWTAKDNCGCVPPARGEEVYGFVSYWGTAEQQSALPSSAAGAAREAKETASSAADPPKEARQTDFSLFSRVSFFGAMLNDLAAYDMPFEVRARAQALAQAAQRHGTQVDLVLHRSDWDLLARRTDAQLQAFAKRAAENAMPLLNQPHEKLGFGQALLLPFWREENMPFSGLTVFFDNLPAPGSDTAAKFRAFHRAFILNLIKQMQTEQLSGRRQGRYRLNIVVPDHQVAEDAKDGLFTFAEMKEFIEQAEPRRPGKKVDAAERTLNVGTTEITLDYVVLLSDLTTDTKKSLRARLDRSSNVTGVHRVVLLESLLPALLRPTAVRALWGPDAPAEQFRDDLAYMKWSFGGVALWELPNTSAADRPLVEHLVAQFRLDNRRWPDLCNFVCPKRIVFRLLLQALAAVSATAIALWFLNCAVRNLGRPYLAFLWSAVFGTAVLALMLLECDPALSAWSGSNWLLIAPLVLLMAVGLYLSFRSRRARP